MGVMLIGCSDKKPDPPSPLSVGLKTYKGTYLQYQYPSSATLKVMSAYESFLLGPSLDNTAPSSDASVIEQGDSHYAYQIHTVIHDNGMRLEPDVWAKNYIINAWKTDRNGTIVYPVTPQGKLISQNARYVQLGRQKGFMVDLFCNDRVIKSVYISRENVIIEMSFSLFPIETDPTAILQSDIYALILGTLSFVGK